METIYTCDKAEMSAVMDFLGGYIFHRTKENVIEWKLASKKFEKYVFDTLKSKNIEFKKLEPEA
jgi:hypothetical protein